MAIAPVNKFVTIAVPVAPGENKLYEVPTGTSAILLYAQVANVGINTYPTSTLIHRRESRSTGNTRDIRVIKDVEIPPNDAAILIDGRLVLEKTALVVDRLFITGSQNGIGTITNVDYDEPTGVATITTMNKHGFSANDPVTLAGIAFTCPSGTGITTSIFPDPQQSYIVDEIVDAVGTSRTFTSVIGRATGYNHTYKPADHYFVRARNKALITGGGYTHAFVSAATSSIIAGGDYTHQYVSAANNAITVQSGGSGNLNPVFADYMPKTGIVTFAFASAHGLSNGATVSIGNTSILFKCAMDNYATTHAYPRPGDPAYGQNLAISGAAGTVFSVNVGASTTVGIQPTAATYNADTGEMVVTVTPGYPINNPTTSKTATTGTTYDALTGILTCNVTNHGLFDGDRIRFLDDSLTFTCSKDSNASNHTYPRSTDPDRNKWFPITVVDNNKFKVGISSAGPDGQFAHTFVSPGTTNGIKVASDSVRIRPDALTFTCSMDSNGSNHTYPRSTDPYYNTAVSIGDTSTNTISLFVGKSPLKYFTPTAADYNPVNGDLVLTVGSGHNLTNGTNVKLENSSLIFTCSQDNNGSEHSYPRVSDPVAGIPTTISSVGTETITINVGASPSGGLVGPLQMEFLASILENSTA